MHIYICIYTHTYTYTYIHIHYTYHTHIHTHINMPQHYRFQTLMLNASSKPSSKQSLHMMISSLKSLSKPSRVTHLIV